MRRAENSGKSGLSSLSGKGWARDKEKGSFVTKGNIGKGKSKDKKKNKGNNDETTMKQRIRNIDRNIE